MLQVTLIGRLTRDPEMRYTPDGVAVCSFNMADNNKWTGADGTEHEDTTWIRVTVWRKQAENAAKYLAKGRQVYIEGRLQADKETGGPRVWTGTDGVAKASYEVTATRMIFLGSAGGVVEHEVGEPDIQDGDVPF